MLNKEQLTEQVIRYSNKMRELDELYDGIEIRVNDLFKLVAGVDQNYRDGQSRIALLMEAETTRLSTAQTELDILATEVSGMEVTWRFINRTFWTRMRWLLTGRHS